MKLPRPQLNVKALIALVACCASLIGAYRTVHGVDPVDRALGKLRSGDVEERRAAAVALGNPGDDRIGEAIPALVRALDDRDVTVRRLAPESLTILFGMVAHGQPSAAEFDRTWAAALALAEASRDADPEVRSAITGALGAFAVSQGQAHRRPADERRLIEALGEAARDPDPSVREWALFALADWWRPGEPVPPALASALHDPSPRVSHAAIRIVGPRCATHPAALRAMIAALREGDRTVGPAAASFLVDPARQSASVFEEVFAQLRDPREAARSNAIDVLQLVGSPPPPCLSLVREALQGEDPATKLIAVHLLLLDADESLGWVVPDIIRWFERHPPGADEAVPGDGLSRIAVDLLGAIGPRSDHAEAAAGELVRHLRGLPPGSRWGAIQALNGFGRRAAPAIPDLIEILDGEPAASSFGMDERHLTLNALGSILADGEDSTLAFAAILDALEDEDRQLRLNAAMNLGRLGPRAWRSAPALARAAEHMQPQDSRWVREALLRIEGVRPTAPPGAREILISFGGRSYALSPPPTATASPSGAAAPRPSRPTPAGSRRLAP